MASLCREPRNAHLQMSNNSLSESRWLACGSFQILKNGSIGQLDGIKTKRFMTFGVRMLDQQVSRDQIFPHKVAKSIAFFR